MHGGSAMTSSDPLNSSKTTMPPTTPMAPSETFFCVGKCSDGTSAKYVGVRYLGSGSCGQVWMAQRKSDSKIFVVKVTMVVSLNDRGRAYAFSERRCLAMCDCPFVVEFIEDFEDETALYIVMHFADGGDLERQLKARAGATPKMYFSEKDVWKVFLQVLLAVDYVHTHKMLHRDVKSANFLLDLSGLCMLGDFGYSHQYEDSVSNAVAQSFCGTPYYLAPEVWKRQRYSKKADCWSVGIVLFEVMQLKKPFQGGNVKAVMNSVLNGNREEMSSEYSQSTRSVVESLLQADPNDRSSIADVLSTARAQEELKIFAGDILRNKLFTEELRAKVMAVVNSAQQRYSAPTAVSSLSESIFSRSSIGLPNYSITHEGTLKKLVPGSHSIGTPKNASWKEVHVVLRDGKLAMSSTPTDTPGKAMDIEHIDSVIPISPTTSHLMTTDASNVFGILSIEGHWMLLQASTKEEMEEWIDVIHLALGIA